MSRFSCHDQTFIVSNIARLCSIRSVLKTKYYERESNNRVSLFIDDRIVEHISTWTEAQAFLELENT